MVDVSPKPATERTAQATARLSSRPEVIEALMAGALPKGDALAVARVAGIGAAKRTAELIPLCHALALDWVEVAFERCGDDALLVRATARTTARTGVEMEALTAATVAALTLYDMAKATDKSIEIGPIRLENKSGGQSGDYVRPDN
jgi:cyclic pyranopterin phosphate synthase